MQNGYMYDMWRWAWGAWYYDIIYYRKVIIKDNDFINTMKDLNNVIDDFKYKINIIKDILNIMINTFDLYYKLSNNIINNYNINKRNYYIFQNLNVLKIIMI